MQRVLRRLRSRASVACSPVVALPVAEEDGPEPVDEASFEEPESYDYDPPGGRPDPAVS